MSLATGLLAPFCIYTVLSSRPTHSGPCAARRSHKSGCSYAGGEAEGQQLLRRRAEAGEDGASAAVDKAQLREIVERQRMLGLDREAGTAYLFMDAAAADGGRAGGRGRGRGRFDVPGGACCKSSALPSARHHSLFSKFARARNIITFLHSSTSRCSAH